MAASSHDDVIDAALEYVKANAILLCVCDSQPTNYTQATATYKLASVVISSGDFGSAGDDSSGRKIAVNAQSSIVIDSSGTAGWVALTAASSVLLYVTDTAATGLTAAGKVNIGTWDINIADPT